MIPGKYSSAIEVSYSPATVSGVAPPFLSRPLKDADFIDGSHSPWPKAGIASPAKEAAVTTAARGDDDVMSTSARTVSPLDPSIIQIPVARTAAS